MELSSLQIPGCWLIDPGTARDGRGFFAKTVHATTFDGHGLNWDFREQYYSRSHANVVRGMHVQAPPHDHEKLVYCLSGRALDVVVDLRAGSPSFGQVVSILLDGDNPRGVYVARGCAHGFLSLTEDCLMVYNVTTEYAPDHDLGILWSTIPFEWPVPDPVVSARDRSFPGLADFRTPFSF